LFGALGSEIFPRQQNWGRRRNAQNTTAAVTLILLLGKALLKALKTTNPVKK
jgi:hypothetical protein